MKTTERHGQKSTYNVWRKHFHNNLLLSRSLNQLCEDSVNTYFACYMCYIPHSFFLRFYLLIHERHREGQRHRQREKQAPCGEPDVGLDPRTPGSRPELNHWATHVTFLKIVFMYDPERGRDTGRGRSRLPAGSPMRDSIPCPQDQALGRRQTLHPWAPGRPK